MAYTEFSHITDWVFDLDHTLYPASSTLFLQLEAKMEAFLIRELAVDLPQAKKLRAEYWREHGTTLAGMMHHHGTDPVTYLDEVQDIDFSCLLPDPALATAIQNLPGRKIIYTNGSSGYAKNAVDALGLTGVFDGLYGIDHAGYISKPHKIAFERVFGSVNLDHKNAVMFEDDPRNLAVPHNMGLKTV
ncbi:MAG: pyrimidine 5'-nucleotidase, partial [Rhodobacteraceae bacterium]|nr:pyrimidine 5'-nucleotidase [Paracoccaceae bacterium]